MLSDWTQLDSGQWGYYLLPGSPALDTGDNGLALDPTGQPLTEDMVGNARIQNDTVDIGAVEDASRPEHICVVTSLQKTVANDGVLTFVEAFEAANNNQPVADGTGQSSLIHGIDDLKLALVPQPLAEETATLLNEGSPSSQGLLGPSFIGPRQISAIGIPRKRLQPLVALGQQGIESRSFSSFTRDSSTSCPALPQELTAAHDAVLMEAAMADVAVRNQIAWALFDLECLRPNSRLTENQNRDQQVVDEILMNWP